jgi:hypothetical protein
MLKILSIKPIDDPPRCAGRYRDVAAFDIQLNDDLRLFDLHLYKSDSGNKIIRAAPTRDRRAATFSPTLAREITDAAFSALNEGLSLDQHTA